MSSKFHIEGHAAAVPLSTVQNLSLRVYLLTDQAHQHVNRPTKQQMNYPTYQPKEPVNEQTNQRKEDITQPIKPTEVTTKSHPME